MATVYALNKTQLLKERELFVDANIFIYRHCCDQLSIAGWMKKYSFKYSTLVWEGYNLRTSFEVISEVINRAMRIAQHNLGCDDLDFKIFRNSPDGHYALGEIHKIIRTILKEVVIVEQSFDNDGVEKLLVIDSLDFVDKSIVAICQGKSYVLFTNDGDFKDADVEVLTSNPVFFAK